MLYAPTTTNIAYVSKADKLKNLSAVETYAIPSGKLKNLFLSLDKYIYAKLISIRCRMYPISKIILGDITCHVAWSNLKTTRKCEKYFLRDKVFSVVPD